jgi:hypothetical protein
MPNYLYVDADKFNPVLDVTIDGRHVQNEDFVSPNPLVLIRLWDENRFVHKKDTSGVMIFLRYPCEDVDCSFERIYFSDPDIEWHAGTGSTEFNVIFTPTQLGEGRYTLRVEATDARNNLAGNSPYEISFNIDYESSVIFFAPHPNPTRGDITFAFSISGETSPDFLGIKIFGTDGKLVHELEKQDAFFVGMNELIWDGKNIHGELLPAGLYIFKIDVLQGSQQVNVKLPAGSNYLKGGYGKIAVVR